MRHKAHGIGSLPYNFCGSHRESVFWSIIFQGPITYICYLGCSNVYWCLNSSCFQCDIPGRNNNRDAFVKLYFNVLNGTALARIIRCPVEDPAYAFGFEEYCGIIPCNGFLFSRLTGFVMNFLYTRLGILCCKGKCYIKLVPAILILFRTQFSRHCGNRPVDLDGKGLCLLFISGIIHSPISYCACPFKLNIRSGALPLQFNGSTVADPVEYCVDS